MISKSVIKQKSLSQLNRIYYVLFVILISLIVSITVNLQSYATISFNKNLLIVDNLFINQSSMSVTDIQTFLETNNSMLATWVDNVDMHRPSDNCIVHNATGMTAAEVIYEASTTWGAQVYDSSGCAVPGAYWSDVAHSNYTLETVSPKVLLVMLQKEQSLISATGTYSTDPNDYKNPSVISSNEYKLARALGYAVPDTGSINDKYLGFYNQINWASWQLRFNYERSVGNTNWDLVDYITYSGPMIEGTYKRCGTCTAETFDGFYPIDGSPLHMDNQSTAALYYYTPHTYPGFFGNYNFVQFYNNWFGNPNVATPWAFKVESITAYGDSARTIPFSNQDRLNMTSGDKAYIEIIIRNTGNQPWTQGVAKLSTISPLDRQSEWSDSSWNSLNRVTTMNETTVSSGNLATFEFSITAPAIASRYYNEKFGIVIEGVKWITTQKINIPINLNELTPLATTNYKLVSGRLEQNEYLLSQDRHSVFTLLSSNNLTLYTDNASVWESNTANVSELDHLQMQSDGNLVLYDESNIPKWNSKTSGNPGAYLQLGIDGNLQILASDDITTLWQTNTVNYPDFTKQTQSIFSSGKMYPGQTITTPDHKYRLTLQKSDGNLVLYSPTKAIWATFRFSENVSRLQMQSDGNLVAYDIFDKPFWNSRTSGHPGSRLVIQQDGNLVIYTPSNVPLWHTGTWGAQ